MHLNVIRQLIGGVIEHIEYPLKYTIPQGMGAAAAAQKRASSAGFEMGAVAITIQSS